MKGITIESTEAAFNEWRVQRSNGSESIPEALWTMALGLYPQHKRSKICRQLHLSGGQFKRRIEDKDPAHSDTGFVLASRNMVNEQEISHSEVQLILQGKERSLRLCVGVDALGQVLAHVSALL
jgi:hypothetical protein